MNNKSNIYGYVCTTEERILRRYAVPFGIVMMGFFAVIFWTEVTKNFDSFAHWLLAIAWSLWLVYLIVSSYRCRVVDTLQFYIEPECVYNICSSNRIVSVDLSGSAFFAKGSYEYGYGKATKTKIFYLFSNNPIPKDYTEGAGLVALKRLHMNDIVIIPRTIETEMWVESKRRQGTVLCLDPK